MGKLGGEELNFASDVDVIYVYSSDQGEAGALSLHEYFAKLCTQVTAALSEVTEDDVVFRVDLRLRPEGAKGAIANSLAQIERYYETFGRPWERQAWIKARAVRRRPRARRRDHGDAAAVRVPAPRPRRRVIDDVRELNRRIKRELVRGGADGFDVKNGDGGIREIEFFVQALQLIHAGKPPAACARRGTLAALDALLFAGLVTDDEHLALWRAYRWLRHVEHVLQLEGGLQTQTIPDDDARACSRAGSATRATTAFDAELARHTRRGRAAVRDARRRRRPRPPRHRRDPARRARPTPTRAAALARLGFADVTAARAELARARRRPGSPLSPAATDRVGARRRALLAELATLGRSGSGAALARRSDRAPRRGVVDLAPARRAARRSCACVGSLLGASAYLARTLVDTPELIDLLVAARPDARRRATADADRAPTSPRGSRRRPRRSREPMWSAIAEVKNGHVLRVGLADFAGALDPLAVCVELTAIAEACLQAALAVVERQLGVPPGDGALAVLALGKLGGRELGYAADLDVVFVLHRRRRRRSTPFSRARAAPARRAPPAHAARPALRGRHPAAPERLAGPARVVARRRGGAITPRARSCGSARR